MQKRQVPEKYSIDEEDLRKYLIEKEQTDEELWKKIQEKAKGEKQTRLYQIEGFACQKGSIYLTA